MRLTVCCWLILALTLITVAEGRFKSKQLLKEQNLPKLDEEKSSLLHPDDEDESQGSGDLKLKPEEEYDDDYYYDDDDEYYEDEDEYDDADYEEGSGDLLEIIEEEEKEADKVMKDIVKMVKEAKKDDEDLHFVEEENHAAVDKDSDLLFEYYNEIYEEDYDLDDQEEESIVDKEVIIMTPKEADPEVETSSGDAWDSTNLLMMIASGMVSFGIFTLAFVLCCYRRRQKSSAKQKNLSIIFNEKHHQHPLHKVVHHNPYGGGVIGGVLPPSSIVKNYQLVPQDAVEFLSSSSQQPSPSSIENSSHILKDPESEKPLLP